VEFSRRELRVKLLLNLATLGPSPTGLGVYASHCGDAACATFETDVIAPPSYRGGGTVAHRSPQDIAIGAGRLAPLRRWIWSGGRARARDRLVYSPTHHGFANETNQILTVHDLIALRFPRQHPAQYLFFRHVLSRQLKRCRAVFTVSNTTREDLHETYRIPLESIHVVPNGVDTSVFQPGQKAQRRMPFLLIVGASFPHKNVDELIAFAHLWKDRYRLLIASCHGRYRTHLQQAVRQAGIESSVTFLAYIARDELVRLYQTCSAFVYPSKWDGFGIPPLEAMACGAPVIASDIPAHREVLGRHATLVRLGDESAWADAFAALTECRLSVAPASFTLLQRYTWDDSARCLIDSLTALEPELARHG
jgi:glycosyltransferase involved in cell wall biosynthesis